nr:hypothetical protein [Rhodoferax sp.]
MPTQELTRLANLFGSDKGDAVLCAHGYTRVYAALLEHVRDQPIRILEIGLVHGQTQDSMRGRLGETGCPSLRMWAEYLRAATIFGFDIEDFRSLSEPRITIFQGDQSRPEDLADLVAQTGGAFDIIIDDGSHASHHQQIALAQLFTHLAPGGLYCIEDLHYQPVDMELPGISTTREFLRDLRFGRSGARLAMDQRGLAVLLGQIGTIHCFDSQSNRWPLAQREDALAVLVKRGEHPLLGDALHQIADRQNLVPTQPRQSDHLAQLPASFFGHTAIHGQTIYRGYTSAQLDPTYLVVTANGRGLQSNDAHPQLPTHYRPGDDIDFHLGGNAPLYQRQGWDFSSEGGNWTIAPSAQLVLNLVDRPVGARDFLIEVLAQGLVGPQHPTTQAELFINGVATGILAFGHQQWCSLPFHAPPEGLVDETLLLDFRILNPISPKALGFSLDNRELGLLLIRVRISYSA